MGYCYEHRTNRLCCDRCGQAGGVIKRQCPHGYCPSPALCRKCNAEVRADGTWKKHHANCKAGHDAFVARENAVKALLAHGAYVRCSALNAANGLVQVLFENQAGETIGRYVSRETYDAIPLMEPATPEDYARFGVVTEAPETFESGCVSKQVAMVG